jgi:Xaa-Pro dipeptidase
VIWYGRGSTPAEALLKYDIDSVLYVDQLYGFISKWLDHNKSSLYALDHTQLPFAEGTMPKVDRSSLRPAMNSARMIKDPHEIKLIRKANDISSRAHKEVLANILRFKNEAQVQGLFLDVCVSHQAKQQAYDIIAASGPNAGTLHYDANNEDFDDRQLMCLDAGCEWQLYASDITRTFPLSGKWPTEESKQIYRLVERMQETCISRLAPGVRFLDLHILAHQIAIDGLMNLGILHNGTKEEIFKAGTSVAFFPHGLGHHVGLEVHDVGQRELMSGMRANTRFQKVTSLPSRCNRVLTAPRLFHSTLRTIIFPFMMPSAVELLWIRKAHTWRKAWLLLSSRASIFQPMPSTCSSSLHRFTPSTSTSLCFKSIFQ